MSEHKGHEGAMDAGSSGAAMARELAAMKPVAPDRPEGSGRVVRRAKSGEAPAPDASRLREMVRGEAPVEARAAEEEGRIRADRVLNPSQSSEVAAHQAVDRARSQLAEAYDQAGDQRLQALVRDKLTARNRVLAHHQLQPGAVTARYGRR